MLCLGPGASSQVHIHALQSRPQQAGFGPVFSVCFLCTSDVQIYSFNVKFVQFWVYRIRFYRVTEGKRTFCTTKSDSVTCRDRSFEHLQLFTVLFLDRI